MKLRPFIHQSWLALVVAFAIACVDPRAPEEADEREACPGYDEEIQPILNVECLSCHGPASANGGFSVYAQSDVWARNRDGVARVVPGDLNCLILVKARDGAGGHKTLSAEDAATVTRWIVSCQGDPLEDDLVHPRGLVDRRSPDFHGKAVRDAGWDFSACEACHGHYDDPFGGKNGKSCLICHKNGPTSCETCHGTLYSPAPPPDVNGNLDTSARGVGAHRAHLVAGPTLATGFECAECHVVPQDWRDPGHIFAEDGSVDPAPAEVILGPLAARSLEDRPELRVAPPTYNPNARTCANVYCHGGALGDPAVLPPIWNRVDDVEACDRCHETPPTTTHAAGLTKTDCALCHPLIVDATGEILEPALHGDGRLMLGDGSKTCHACHGSPESPAPPPALNESAASLAAIGGHALHLGGSTFAGRYECDVCHLVPVGDSFLTAINAPGHIDSLLPAEVFPGGASFPGLAAKDGATPMYDHDTHTCTGVYCHGSGAELAQDTASGISRSLTWTDAITGAVQCGSCHGLPPQGIGHMVPPTGATCADCHPITVRADGSVIIAPNGTSAHADGGVQ